MSRLTTQDIKHISNELYAYDKALFSKHGFTLLEVAKASVGLSRPPRSRKTAVVPVTSGLGIIEGFSQTVNDILQYCNADAFITGSTDVAGLREAYEREADIVFMADDAVCSAFSLNGRVFSDNGYATGISFAAALTMMMDEVEDQEALVLGAGPVGIAAAGYLAKAGAVPVICDLHEKKACQAADKIAGAGIELDTKRICEYTYIVDATTAADLITIRDVTPDTRISAPGVPLGVTGEAAEMVPVFHNPLELGIMTMYFDCIKQLGDD